MCVCVCVCFYVCVCVCVCVFTNTHMCTYINICSQKCFLVQVSQYR